jgi:hypothetical protein
MLLGAYSVRDASAHDFASLKARDRAPDPARLEDALDERARRPAACLLKGLFVEGLRKWDPASIAHNVLNFLRIVRNTWGPDGRRSEPPQLPKFTILFKNVMPAKVGSHLEADAHLGARSGAKPG